MMGEGLVYFMQSRLKIRPGVEGSINAGGCNFNSFLRRTVRFVGMVPHCGGMSLVQGYIQCDNDSLPLALSFLFSLLSFSTHVTPPLPPLSLNLPVFLFTSPPTSLYVFLLPLFLPLFSSHSPSSLFTPLFLSLALCLSRCPCVWVVCHGSND